jgi:hypothetical protein
VVEVKLRMESLSWRNHSLQDSEKDEGPKVCCESYDDEDKDDCGESMKISSQRFAGSSHPFLNISRSEDMFEKIKVICATSRFEMLCRSFYKQIKIPCTMIETVRNNTFEYVPHHNSSFPVIPNHVIFGT